MSGSIGTVFLDVETNTQPMRNQMNNLGRTATGMLSSSFAKLGGVIAGAFAGYKLLQFGKSAIELASNLSEVQNVVDVTFGKSAAEINKFSKDALAAFGLSELSAKKFSSTLGAMFKSSGIAQGDMVQMSEQLTGLAGDMASFYNLSQDDAFLKIQAGISGETEPLKRLGINMSVANLQAFALSQGIKGNVTAMTQAQQTLLRYNYLMSVTKDAQGDFARTSGSWANQIRLLKEQWNSFKTTLGGAFIQMLAPMVQWLNILITKLQVAAEYFAAFVSLITGQKVNVSSATDANNGLSDSADGVADSSGKAAEGINKASKAASKSVASFDEVNQLNLDKPDSGSGGSGSGGAGTTGGLGDPNLGGGSGTPSIDTSAIEGQLAWIKTMMQQVGDWFNDYLVSPMQIAFSMISPEVDEFSKTVGKMFTDIQTLAEPFKSWFQNDFTSFLQNAIIIDGQIFSQLLDSANKVFSDLWNVVIFPTLTTFITDGLPMMTQFADQANQTFATVFTFVKDGFDKLWSDGASPALGLITTIWQDTVKSLKGNWDKYGADTFESIRGAINSTKDLFDTTWNTVLKPLLNNLFSVLKQVWKDGLKPLVDALGEFAAKAIKVYADIHKNFISPLLQAFVKQFGPPVVATFNGIVKVIGGVVTSLGKVLTSGTKALSKFLDFLEDVFHGRWKAAWKDVKAIVSNIFDALAETLKSPFRIVIGLINTTIDAINKMKITVPSWVPGIGGSTYGFNLPRVPMLAKGGIVDSPTLAMIGEAGKEAVVPLENTAFVTTLADAVKSAVMEAIGNSGGSSGTTGGGDIYLTIDGMVLAKGASKYINKAKRQGVTLLNV